jgi:hypothetical protein
MMNNISIEDGSYIDSCELSFRDEMIESIKKHIFLSSKKNQFC